MTLIAPVPPRDSDSTAETETRRVSALAAYEILPTHEAALDDLALLAARITGSSMAFVNLVDGDRVWAKASFGGPLQSCRRTDAFCSTAVTTGQTLVIGDAPHDATFAHLPVVASGQVRSYAGAPLINADGQVLGTLCVMDPHQRSLSVDQVDALEALSRQVVAQLELRRRASLLAQSHLRYESLVERSPAGVMVIEGDIIRFANAVSSCVIGAVVGDLSDGLSLSALFDASSRGAVDEYVRSLEGHRVPQLVQLDLTRQDRRSTVLTLRSVPIHWEGRPATQIEFSDVTEQAEQDRKIWLSERRLQALFDHAPVGQVETDASGVILTVNPYLCQLLGYPSEDLVGRNLASFSPHTSTQGCSDHLQEQKRFRRRDGSSLPALVSTAVVRDPAGEPLRTLAMVLDISDLEHRQTQLRHRAEHDPLTGLTNRSALSEPWLGDDDLGGTVLYIDLDRFKAVNDTYGHVAGDAALVAVAGRLRRLVRLGDRVARIGGDEFVVFCPGLIDRGRATQLVAQIRATLREPVGWRDTELTVGASIGIAIGRRGVPLDELLERADQAMFVDKGRTRSPGAS